MINIYSGRCKHAGDTKDYEYIEKAIELGAARIVFTDHAPFLGNPFGHRMDIEELPEYVASINTLKEQYKDKIEILCGLEIEYLPSFIDYYKKLSEMKGLNVVAHPDRAFRIRKKWKDKEI